MVAGGALAPGDEELVDFFTRVRDEDSMRADEAQQLLAERTPTAERTEGTTTGAVAGTEEGPPGREDRLPREERATRKGKPTIEGRERATREGRSTTERRERQGNRERRR